MGAKVRGRTASSGAVCTSHAIFVFSRAAKRTQRDFILCNDIFLIVCWYLCLLRTCARTLRDDRRLRARHQKTRLSDAHAQARNLTQSLLIDALLFFNDFSQNNEDDYRFDRCAACRICRRAGSKLHGQAERLAERAISSTVQRVSNG